MLSIGILSTASIVPRFIAAANDSGCCKITAIASRRLDVAREFADKYCIDKAYGSYDELLDDPDIDTIYVAMISSEHAAWAKKVLRAGKHLLCEKPIALDPKDVTEIFELANGNGLFAMEMQKAVFLPVMQELKQRLSSGELGEIHMASFSSSFSIGYNNWFMDLSKGGGPWFSNAGYTIALLQYLFDCDISGYNGVCTKSNMTAESQFQTSLSLENGMLAACRCSALIPLPNVAVLYGSKGHVEIPDFWKARTAVIHINGAEPEVLEYPCEHELVYEILHAADCISKGLSESPVMTKNISLKTTDILQKMSLSWKKLHSNFSFPFL